MKCGKCIYIGSENPRKGKKFTWEEKVIDWSIDRPEESFESKVLGSSVTSIPAVMNYKIVEKHVFLCDTHLEEFKEALEDADRWSTMTPR